MSLGLVFSMSFHGRALSLSSIPYNMQLFYKYLKSLVSCSLKRKKHKTKVVNDTSLLNPLESNFS